MFSAESRGGRRIVGTLERGADLHTALLAACGQHGVRCAEVRASGCLQSARLTSYDQAGKQWRPAHDVAGALELIGFSGSVSEQAGALVLSARATLMRDRDVGVEVVGGYLAGAQVFSVEYVIESFDDLILRRHADAATGLDVWTDAVELAPSATPAATPAPAPAPTVAAAPVPTAPRPAPIAAATPAPFEDAALHPGDVLVHPKFGRCTVVRLEGELEFAHVRLRNARVVRLSLEVMTLRPRGTEDGQRVFEAHID